jgi:hypothetical protein
MAKKRPPTKAQWDRMRRIKEMGCIISGEAPCQCHHLLSGGVRRGHDFTIGLSRHLHETRNDDGTDPSYHGAKKRFNRMYGSDEELIAKQNKMLGL